MLSLTFIRENPDVVREALRRRHEEAPIDEILRLDTEWRGIVAQVESLRAQRNATSTGLSKMKEKPPELLAEMRRIGDQIRELDARQNDLKAQLDNLLLYVPNIPHPDVPE